MCVRLALGLYMYTTPSNPNQISPTIPPTQHIPTVVATRSLGLSFGLIHAVDDAGILAVQVAIGRMLDQGKTYRGSVLPMLLGFALLGAGATVALMRLLRRKLEAASALPQRDDAGLERELEVEMMVVEPRPMTTVVAVESPN